MLAALPPVARVIHGGCRGADNLGGWAARRQIIPVRVFRAEWERKGRAAGSLRNQCMLDEGRLDIVLAFHDDIASSLGTADMVRRTLAAGVQVRLVSLMGDTRHQFSLSHHAQKTRSKCTRG